MIKVEAFLPGMAGDLWLVFHSSVRVVCAADYTDAQVRAWAPDTVDQQLWAERMKRLDPLVAKAGTTVVGFADLQPDGYIDHFYVHGDYQSMGVGTTLMKQIIARSQHLDRIHSQVSITAKPFFARHGFVQNTAHEVYVRGQPLTNFVMARLHGSLAR